MNGKGKQSVEDTEEYRPTGMARRVRQPLFEKDIISPGTSIEDAFTSTYFIDEDKLNKACKYIAWLEEFNNHDGIRQALYKINGNKAIGYRAVKHGVMAHGELYWDGDASKDDKKYLSKIQAREHRDDEGKEDKEGAP